MIINILKAITYFFGFVIFFAFLHTAQHSIMGQYLSGLHPTDAKQDHKVKLRRFRDGKGELVKHGFLQHHLHAQDGRIVWQKASDTIEASITKDNE
jgi:hypothetical protein